jgi:hypothetical protein
MQIQCVSNSFKTQKFRFYVIQSILGVANKSQIITTLLQTVQKNKRGTN